jgi:hypothetical protein
MDWAREGLVGRGCARGEDGVVGWEVVGWRLEVLVAERARVHCGVY